MQDYSVIFFLIVGFIPLSLVFLSLFEKHAIIILIILDILILISIVGFIYFSFLANIALGYFYALLLFSIAAIDTAFGLLLVIAFIPNRKN